MIQDSTKAKVLESVARGQTLPDAASANGLKTSQGRDAISRICRYLKLSADISEIQSNPDKYIAAALSIINDPKYSLQNKLRKDLQHKLSLRSADELTPKYISNLTAEMLLSAGVSESSLVSVQAWMINNDSSLLSHKRLTKKA